MENNLHIAQWLSMAERERMTPLAPSMNPFT